MAGTEKIKKKKQQNYKKVSKGEAAGCILPERFPEERCLGLYEEEGAYGGQGKG